MFNAKDVKGYSHQIIYFSLFFSLVLVFFTFQWSSDIYTWAGTTMAGIMLGESITLLMLQRLIDKAKEIEARYVH